jgi:hypothetical protein
MSFIFKDKGNNTISLKHEFSLSLSTVTKWNRSKLILKTHQPTFVKKKQKDFSKN